MRYLALTAALIAAPSFTQAEQSPPNAQQTAPTLADMEADLLQSLASTAGLLGSYIGLLIEDNRQKAETETPSPEEIHECLSPFFRVELAADPQEMFAREDLRVTVTNISDHSFLALRIEAQLWSSDRPAPLLREVMYEATEIPGAFLPGETLALTETFFPRARAKILVSQATDLELRLAFRNALTLEGHVFGGWGSHQRPDGVETQEFDCPNIAPSDPVGDRDLP